eukprot:426167_1
MDKVGNIPKHIRANQCAICIRNVYVAAQGVEYGKLYSVTKEKCLALFKLFSYPYDPYDDKLCSICNDRNIEEFKREDFVSIQLPMEADHCVRAVNNYASVLQCLQTKYDEQQKLLEESVKIVQAVESNKGVYQRYPMIDSYDVVIKGLSNLSNKDIERMVEIIFKQMETAHINIRKCIEFMKRKHVDYVENYYDIQHTDDIEFLDARIDELPKLNEGENNDRQWSQNWLKEANFLFHVKGKINNSFDIMHLYHEMGDKSVRHFFHVTSI